jgi:putative flippase GtrA
VVNRLVARLPELSKFGSVGLLAYFVDLGVFNLVLLVLRTSPLTAKICSVAVATLVAWLGNRYWTFTARKTAARGKELLGFAFVNVIGLGIGLLCLWISHYLLGFTSPIADNISANVIGLALGTLFRYFAYRKFVFTG